eukprot:scaffold2854_cov124-Pinguiococcus_pyrenoidosus.AAC.1
MMVVTAVNLRVELDASQEAVKSRMKPAWEISPLQQMPLASMTKRSEPKNLPSAVRTVLW